MISLNREQIKEIIPHRDPFLLLSRVNNVSFEELITDAELDLTGEEDFFKGHFPNKPIMPGVLILEAAAQAGAVSILGREENRGKIALFLKANNVKFKDMVIPPCTLRFHVYFIKGKMGLYVSKAEAYVKDKMVAEAEVTCALK